MCSRHTNPSSAACAGLPAHTCSRHQPRHHSSDNSRQNSSFHPLLVAGPSAAQQQLSLSPSHKPRLKTSIYTKCVHAVVFGKVEEGMPLVRRMESCGSRSGKTLKPISIADCGELPSRRQILSKITAEREQNANYKNQDPLQVGRLQHRESACRIIQQLR